MKKNKININPTPLNPSDIEAGKNFGTFHQQYQRSQSGSLLRRLALPSLAAVAAAVIIAVIVFRLPDGSTELVSSFISPPIEGLERAYENFAFIVEEGLDVQLPSGTAIHIPANAFVDANGKPFTGEAILKYREFTDYLSIALSGIPMTYDSAGAKYTFESAGMFDIQVETKPKDNNASQPLSLADGAVVSVGLIAENEDTDFNVYELDTTNRNWVLRGQDSVFNTLVPTDVPVITMDDIRKSNVTSSQKNEVTDAQLESMANSLRLMADSLTYYRNLSYLKPEKSSTEAHLFQLPMKFGVVEYPELVLNEIVAWEVAPFTEGFDARYTTTRWDKRTVTRIKGNEYNIKLEKDGTEYNFKCKPVYHGKHYQTALKYYTDELVRIETRIAQLVQLQADMQQRYNTYKTELQTKMPDPTPEPIAEAPKTPVDNKPIQEEVDTLANTAGTVYRFVEVDRMGIWNIDRIFKQPEYVRVESEFVDSKGEVLAIHRVILFEKQVNGSFEFFKMPDSHTVRFLYNPANSYSGLGITTEGKVFLITPSDIKKVTKKGINTIQAKDLFVPKSEQQLREKLKAIA